MLGQAQHERNRLILFHPVALSLKNARFIVTYSMWLYSKETRKDDDFHPWRSRSPSLKTTLTTPEDDALHPWRQCSSAYEEGSFHPWRLCTSPMKKTPFTPEDDILHDWRRLSSPIKTMLFTPEKVFFPSMKTILLTLKCNCLCPSIKALFSTISIEYIKLRRHSLRS